MDVCGCVGVHASVAHRCLATVRRRVGHAVVLLILLLSLWLCQLLSLQDLMDDGHQGTLLDAFTEVTEIGDPRQSDQDGRGVLFKTDLAAGTHVVDPGGQYYYGAAPNHLWGYDYIKLAH